MEKRIFEAMEKLTEVYPQEIETMGNMSMVGEGHNVPTIGLEPNVAIRYNPEFIAMASDEQIKHSIAFLAELIRGGFFLPEDERDHYIWNLAVNYYISNQVKESGAVDLSLLEGYVFEERFLDMSAEEIYDVLEEEMGANVFEILKEGLEALGLEAIFVDEEEFEQEENFQDNLR